MDGIAEFYVEYGKKLKIKPNVASGYAPGHFIVNGSIYQPDTYEGYVYSDTIISYTVGQVE